MMRKEIIKTEAGIQFIKFYLSPCERVGQFMNLLPDLLFPRFWDGEGYGYGSLLDRWEIFIDDLKASILGYRILCQPVYDTSNSTKIKETRQ